MPYDRTVLMRRCALARTLCFNEASRRHTQKIKKWHADASRWRDDALPVLLRLAAEIERVRDQDLAVLARTEYDRITRSFRWSSPYFDGPAESPGPFDADDATIYPTWLNELEGVLTATNDPVVSSHALEKAGVLGHVRKLPHVATSDGA